MIADHLQTQMPLNKVCMYLSISSSQALSGNTPEVTASARENSLSGET
jgi:hypothetical protein